MQPQCKQIWEEWVNESCNWLFQQKVEDLFESATKQNGEPFYTLETVNDAVSSNRKTMSNIIQLRLEKERIEELNEWALAKETKESDFPRPTVSQYLNWTTIISGAGHEKGVYATHCEAVWHGLENRQFRLLWKEKDNNSEEILFIKQMLREATWMDCTRETCTLFRSMGKQCPMLTKQFESDTMITSSVYQHDIPIMQVEVCGEKPQPEKDERKLCIISCWNLCYASLTYGMEVGKDWASLIKMKKNCKTGIIDTNKYRVDLNGAETDSKIFVDLLKLLEMMVAALYECIGQEEEIYENCQKLVKLTKLKPGSEIKNKTNIGNVGSTVS